MPRVSRRFVKVSRYKKWFRFRMQSLMLREALSDDDDSMEDDTDFLITTLYSGAKQKRYHFRNEPYRSRLSSVLDHYLDMSETEFLLHFRVHKESFWKLHDYIVSCNEFRRKRKPNGTFYKPQCPVKYQLLIFLYVIGTTGSDGNYKRVGSRFRISSGAVSLYVNRVTKAILDKLESEVVHWPNAIERKFISE